MLGRSSRQRDARPQAAGGETEAPGFESRGLAPALPLMLASRQRLDPLGLHRQRLMLR